LRQCLYYASDLGLPVHLSARTAGLDAGCAHDGPTATRLGLSGIPASSETVALSVISALVEETGCRVHLSRLSSAAGARIYAQALERGLPLSADVTAWNLLYTDQALAEYDVQFHLQPPLRSESDRQALLEFVAQGTISSIVSGHTPHGHDAKFGPFPETQPGASSLDGFLALLLQLVAANTLSALEMAARTSVGPAAIVGTAVDNSAWLLVDPAHTWALTAQTMHSAAYNSPLLGQSLRGCAAGWITAEKIEMLEHWQARLGV
jgi:dihydroorotase